MTTLPTDHVSGDTGHVEAHNETNTEVNSINDALAILNSLAEYFVNADPTIFLNAKENGSVAIYSNGDGNVSIGALAMWDFLIDPFGSEVYLRAGADTHLKFQEDHAEFRTTGYMQIVADGGDGITLGAPQVFVESDLLITDPGRGVVLAAPDTTRYRLKVANDGTLSTEVVV